MGNGDEDVLGDKAPAEEQANEHVKAFFLDLAAKGKADWNAWRCDTANKGVPVTFAGVDFSEAPRDEIDFSGLKFGDNADFSQCHWRGVDWAQIREDPIAFAPGRASFTGAAFGGGTVFTEATFGDSARFANATFGEFAIFYNATFGRDATFTGATFGKGVDFTGAALGPLADFAKIHFKGVVVFSGVSEEKWADNAYLRFDRTEDEAQRHWELWELDASGPDRFLTISFANARFDREAVFSDRSFKMRANFTGARFYFPPDFDGVTGFALIDFAGAHFGFSRPGKLLHWTKNSRTPVLLRAFRKVAEETKNHDLERDLYIEERKAERGVYLHQLFEELKKARWIERPLIAWQLVAHLFWISVMLGYLVLANYGRSFLLPLAWLGLSGYGFYWLYLWILEPITSKMGPLDTEKYKHAVRMLALGNTLPFVGPLTIDADIKKFLFCPGFGSCLPTPPEGYQLLVLSQNLLSIILVFFIGLSLRNYFKIK